MRIQNQQIRPTISSAEAAKPSAPRQAPAAKATSWGPAAGAANVARDVRAALAHPQGRVAFAELLENHLGNPDAGTGYVWDPADKGAMQWTLRNSEMGDDSLLVRVNGKELSIQSENSGFEGKAVFSGSSPEALSNAISAAVKSLEATTQKHR